jgi:uracil-DNA glycosylase family 4
LYDGIVEGAALLVGEGPGKEEDAIGKPFVGVSGKKLRQLVHRYTRAPVVFDNALRCWYTKIDSRYISACRGFLSKTISDGKPERIITLGSAAALSVLGRTIKPLSARRAVGWIAKTQTPVYMVMHPAAALRNRFLMKMFEEDLEWALTVPEPPYPPPDKYTMRIVESEAEALEAEADLSCASWFAFDCEASGRLFDTDYSVFNVSCCAKDSTFAWVWDSAALENPRVLEPLLRLLRNPKIGKGGHNVKYDSLAIECAFGSKVVNADHDTLLDGHIYDPEMDGGLDAMAELVGMGGHKLEAMTNMARNLDWFTKRKKKTDARQTTLFEDPIEDLHLPLGVEASIRLGGDIENYKYALIDHDIVCRYNARDAVVTARLREHIRPEIEAVPELRKVSDDLAHPAMRAFTQMESWGICVSHEAVTSVGLYLDHALAEVKNRLSVYKIDPNSNDEVGKLLYDTLKLRCGKLTPKGSRSVDKEALTLIKGEHPVVVDILENRRLTKMKGTYVDGFYPHIKADGRIHPNVHVDGARTGRASISDPPLHQVPRASDSTEGKMLRDMFVAPPGCLLVQADYRQLEYRIAAALSGDIEMIKVIRSGKDFHLGTAELIAQIMWGIQPEEIQKPHRTTAKTLNFALIFGMADKTLAARLGCTIEEATRVREAVLGKYKMLARWISDHIAYTKRSGVSWTWWNGGNARRRPLWRIASQDSEERSTAEHGSINTPIQGTAADYDTASVIEITNWILEEGLPLKLVLAVHDSIVLEVPEQYVSEAVYMLHKVMTSWPVPNDVPLDVDIEVGTSWGSLEEYND